MKTKIILTIIFWALFFAKSNAQFTDPTDGDGPLSNGLKTIKENNNYCNPSALGHKKKKGTPRRFKFRALFYPECWYIEENLPENPGWNKLGKIAGLIDSPIPDEDYYKLHVGWRMVTINNQPILGIGLFGHTGYNIIAHWLDSIPFNSYAQIWVDMYLGRNIWGLVVDDKCIGVQNSFTSEFWDFRTRLRKTFYFGGKNTAPHEMYLYYDNIHFDKPGYQDYFNSRNHMIWNLTEFWNGDNYIFYANKLIEGSVKNPSAVTSLPIGYNKQECNVNSGATIYFISGESVVLHPGFHAKDGSHFVAKIGSKDVYDELSVKVNNSEKNITDTLLNPLKKDLTDDLSLKNSKLDFSINKLSKKGNYLSIYPNPNPGLFNIDLFEQDVSDYSVEIVNTMGKTVYKKQNIPIGKTEIDISNQSKGVYFVKLQVGDKLITEKVVYR